MEPREALPAHPVPAECTLCWWGTEVQPSPRTSLWKGNTVFEPPGPWGRGRLCHLRLLCDPGPALASPTLLSHLSS